MAARAASPPKHDTARREPVKPPVVGPDATPTPSQQWVAVLEGWRVVSAVACRSLAHESPGEVSSRRGSQRDRKKREEPVPS